MALGLLRVFMPRDRTFFPLITETALNLETGGKALFQLLTDTDPAKRDSHLRRIEAIEQLGDEFTHELLTSLLKANYTPADKDDLHRLANSLDDALDYIHAAARRIEMFSITDYTSEMVKLGSIIQVQTEEVRSGLLELKNMHRMRDITNVFVRINSLENHADEVFEKALVRLFAEEPDVKRIIQYKDVLQMMEEATDKCEDVANVMESIVVKMKRQWL